MRAFALTFALVTASSLGAATGAATTPPEIVALPEFRVFADHPLPEPEAWHYVRVGNFEILSNASARTTKRFAKDFRDFENVLNVVWPAARIRSELPAMVVLCGKGDTFKSFAVKPTIRSTGGLATTLVRDEEIASIVVDYGASSISDPLFANAIDWVASRDIQPTEEFFREYIHLGLSQLNPRPPAWFAEGLANIYSKIDYTNKWIEVGLPKSFRNEYEVRAIPGLWNPQHDFLRNDSTYFGDRGTGDYTFRHDRFSSFNNTYTYIPPIYLQPFAELFAVSYGSSELTGAAGSNNLKLTNWQKQSTAFTHLCLFGENGRYRAPFLKFVARAMREPVSEEIFQECFGMNYRQMGIKLRGYSEFTNYTSMLYKAKKGTDFLAASAPIVVRRATDAEIGRIKGETLRLAGQDDAARREFVIAYLRGERDPQLLASLGLMARQRNDDARAKTYLEAVAASPTAIPRPRAYLELARLRHAQSRGPENRPLNAAQVAQVLKPLFVTQDLQPQLAAVYMEIAQVWENSAVPPNRRNLAALEHGVRIFPWNGELIYHTAALLIKHGHKADAATMLQRAIELTRDPELRARFEELRRRADVAAPLRTGSLSRALPESTLTAEQRQALADYRTAKTSAATELRGKIASVAHLEPAAREQALAAFALTQGPRLNVLERDAVRLEANLGRPPDENEDYVFGAASPDARSQPGVVEDLGRLRAALLRPQGLSPPQRGLIHEMILAIQDGAATHGAFSFFSPDTARVRFPADLPAELAAEIAAYGQRKDALKEELRAALRQNESLNSELVSTVGLSALAEQQTPRFTALEETAETIRRRLALLPARPASLDTPSLPPELASRLTAYQTNRTELQRNARRELRALRNQLPAGADIVATGEAPRLELKFFGPATPALQQLRTAIETFNRDYAGRFAELNRDLAGLRGAIAEHARLAAAGKSGKSIDDLTQDFIGAAVRQSATEAYEDGRAAVFLPGLSPEQRRLLFGRLGEKHPAFIFEF